MGGRSIGLSKWELDTPAAVIDLEKLNRNIEEMAAFARKVGVALRPHTKTHKMIPVAKRQLAAGASGLTVAKLSEAEVMVETGCTDILVANQVVTPAKVRRLLDLNQRATVMCAVDNIENAQYLSDSAVSAGTRLRVLIEVDTGLHRCGVAPGSPALHLARRIAEMPGLELCGLMTHAGHAYGAGSAEEIARIGHYEAQALVDTAAMLKQEGLPCPVVSVGSTPTVRHAAQVPGVTEIRPGNYVFYDAVQVALGSATEEQCALTVLATVISRPSPDRAVIDAGSKALSLDRGAHGRTTARGFGLVRGHPEYLVERLSEEHGVLTIPEDSGLRIGEKLEIIPNHACAVVNLFDSVAVVERDVVIDIWRVDARGRST